MARGSTTKPKAKAQNKRAAPKPAANSSSLAEKLDKDTMSSSSRAAEASAKRRRTEAQAVAKVLADNFGGFSEAELHLHEVGGFTLSGRIAEDRARVQRGEHIAMGKVYYEGLRRKYRSPSSAHTMLEPLDENEPLDDHLVAALEALVSGRKTSDLLISWTEAVSSVSQRNLVALFRQLLVLPPSKSLEQASISIAVMKMLVRIGLDKKFPEEVGCMASQWDAACVKSLASFKAQQRSGTCWWEASSSWACLVLPMVATTKALIEKDSLESVSDEINSVVEGSEVGQRLLARAQKQLQLERLSTRIKEHVARFDNEAITQELLDARQAEFISAVKALGYEPMQRHVPKDMDFLYRGERISIAVNSPLEQYQVAVQCMVRGRATELGVLPALFCENALVAQVSARPPAVDEKCVQTSKLARSLVADQLDASDASKDAIMNVLKEKRSFLTTTDRFWKIEHSFWACLAGSLAELKTHRLILDCLPADNRRMTLAQSKQMFKMAEGCALLAFVGASLRATVATVASYVETMTAGKSPTIERTTGDTSFAFTVQSRLALFCEAPGPSADASPLRGAAAAAANFQSLSTRAEDAPQLTYSDLVPCLTFSWLLDADQRSQLDRLKLKVVAMSGATNDSTSEKKGSAKKAAIDTKAMVRSLFSKS